MRTRGLVLLMALCSAAFAAQGQDTSRTSDTSRSHNVLIIDPGVALGKPILLFPPFLEPDLKFSDTDIGIRGPFLQGGYTLKADLIPPSMLPKKQGAGLTMFYNVLGAAELGAAGYLAYRHIKKYGLFR
jgi:hypothetical protein